LRRRAAHVAGWLLHGGLAVFAVGVVTWFFLLFGYFYTTPVDVCLAAFATRRVSDVWPWAMPLFAVQITGLACAALGLLLVRVGRFDPARRNAR
jgi:hypothetical protein